MFPAQCKRNAGVYRGQRAIQRRPDINFKICYGTRLPRVSPVLCAILVFNRPWLKLNTPYYFPLFLHALCIASPYYYSHLDKRKQKLREWVARISWVWSRKVNSEASSDSQRHCFYSLCKLVSVLILNSLWIIFSLHHLFHCIISKELSCSFPSDWWDQQLFFS